MKREKIAVFNASIVDDLDATVETTRFKFDPLYSGGLAFIEGFDAPAVEERSVAR